MIQNRAELVSQHKSGDVMGPWQMSREGRLGLPIARVWLAEKGACKSSQGCKQGLQRPHRITCPVCAAAARCRPLPTTPCPCRRAALQGGASAPGQPAAGLMTWHASLAWRAAPAPAAVPVQLWPTPAGGRWRTVAHPQSCGPPSYIQLRRPPSRAPLPQAVRQCCERGVGDGLGRRPTCCQLRCAMLWGGPPALLPPSVA